MSATVTAIGDSTAISYAFSQVDDEMKHHKRLPAPKMTLPGNAESYNPPEEYLFTDAEREAWEKMDPTDRRAEPSRLRQIPDTPSSTGSSRLDPALYHPPLTGFIHRSPRPPPSHPPSRPHVLRRHAACPAWPCAGR